MPFGSLAKLFAFLASAAGISLVSAFVVRLASQWLEKWKPPYWRAYWAAWIGNVLAVEVFWCIATAFFSKPFPFPVTNQNCMVPFFSALLVNAVVIGALLKDPSGNELGLVRAFSVSGLTSMLPFGFISLLGLSFLFSKEELRSAVRAAEKSKAEPVVVAKPTPLPMFPVQRFSTVAEAQREAVRLYPSLGIAGSQFNRDFLARYNQYRRERPSYFDDTSWPLRLAEEMARAGAK